VQAFFQALSPVELDVYSRAVAAQQQATSQVSQAHHQHLERLRYEAQRAPRQFLRVDPDNRLVAAALEKRWHEALAELKRVEEAQAHRDAPALPLLPLSEELQTAWKRDWSASSHPLAARAHLSASEKGAVTLPHRQGGGTSTLT
jgi:transposase InsO family protein